MEKVETGTAARLAVSSEELLLRELGGGPAGVTERAAVDEEQVKILQTEVDARAKLPIPEQPQHGPDDYKREVGWQIIGMSLAAIGRLGELGVNSLMGLMSLQERSKHIGRAILSKGPLNSPALGRKLTREHEARLRREAVENKITDSQIKKAVTGEAAIVTSS